MRGCTRSGPMGLYQQQVFARNVIDNVSPNLPSSPGALASKMKLPFFLKKCVPLFQYCPVESRACATLVNSPSLVAASRRLSGKQHLRRRGLIGSRPRGSTPPPPGPYIRSAPNSNLLGLHKPFPLLTNVPDSFTSVRPGTSRSNIGT